MHFLFRSKTRPPRTRRPNPPFPRASLLRRLSVQLRSGGKWKFSEIGRRKSPSLDIARVRGKPLARRSRVPNLGGWRIMNRAVKFSFILTCWQKFYTVILKQQTPKCKRTWLPWIWIMFPTALGPWLMEPKPEPSWNLFWFSTYLHHIGLWDNYVEFFVDQLVNFFTNMENYSLYLVY